MNTIVVGGGAAGMMAAIIAARNNNKVTLLEKNEKLGKKVYITGKADVTLQTHAMMKPSLKALSQILSFYTVLIMDLIHMRQWNSLKASV